MSPLLHIHLARKVQPRALLDRLEHDPGDEGRIVARDRVSALVFQRTCPGDDDPVGFGKEVLDGGLTEQGAEESEVVWVQVVA